MEIREKDGLRGKTVLIADFENPENYEFFVINRLTVIGEYFVYTATRRICRKRPWILF